MNCVPVCVTRGTSACTFLANSQNEISDASAHFRSQSRKSAHTEFELIFDDVEEFAVVFGQFCAQTRIQVQVCARLQLTGVIVDVPFNL